MAFLRTFRENLGHRPGGPEEEGGQKYNYGKIGGGMGDITGYDKGGTISDEFTSVRMDKKGRKRGDPDFGKP